MKIASREMMLDRVSECATGQPEEGEAINNLRHLIPTNVSMTLAAIGISVRDHLFDLLGKRRLGITC